MGLFSFLNKNKQDSADDDALAARARAKRASSAGEPAGRGRREPAADPVLPEKKRARRRLVGAIALALAVAIGLPMVLDAEPKSPTTDIDIRIPAKENVAPQPLPRAVAAADALDAREQIVEPPPAVAEVKIAKAETKPEPRLEPKLPPKAEPKAEPKTDPKPEPKVVKTEPKPEPKETRPEPKLVPKPAEPDAARAIAILEGKAAEAASQKYVVQVAALASQEKVTELQDKLKAAGIKSYTQKVPTQAGERIRIRVGPLSREEAESVRAKLGKIGLAGSMVPA